MKDLYFNEIIDILRMVNSKNQISKNENDKLWIHGKVRPNIIQNYDWYDIEDLKKKAMEMIYNNLI